MKLFDSAAAFLREVPRDTPGCLVLDVRLPGVSGLEFQGLLARDHAQIPIIFMTGHGDIPRDHSRAFTNICAEKGGTVIQSRSFWRTNRNHP